MFKGNSPCFLKQRSPAIEVTFPFRIAGEPSFVLTKIDEILASEQEEERECDTRFVELGGYCPKYVPDSTGGSST
ncbi:MAG: hypothetical protein DMG68_14125 [Acidobacteria bacterium]|nr:MAG: hypothetical protein DMG68_14125 [Acidobacteriota bacterium]